MNAGLEARKRNPLQDYNQMQLQKVTTEGKTCNFLISEVIVELYKEKEVNTFMDFNTLAGKNVQIMRSNFFSLPCPFNNSAV